MQPTISFPWVNGGREFVLPDITMAGDDELDRLTERHATTLVHQRQSYLLNRLVLILAVKKVLDMGKPERAYKAWLEALPTIEPPQSQEAYRWTSESFASEFEVYFSTEVEGTHGVQGYAEADAFLKERVKALEKSMKDTPTPLQFKEYQKERIVTELYWRLKDQFRTIALDGQDVPLNPENLRKVIRMPSDWVTFAQAVIASRQPAPADKERSDFLEDLTAEDLKKNSPSSATSGKPSRTVSPSTSGHGTASAPR